MPYSDEFNDWWLKRSTKIPKDKRAVAKRWAWVGWQGFTEYEQAEGEAFRLSVEADRAKGIDVSNPGYWGDFS
jgi:hypothetical protein